ncbi:MAG: sulfatase-like hydrolase/transferase [Candidatus Brocadiaceae bacterium]|nr:sulfatase-like hydrolase/transferase [Candidatus Brocadiaceae bacterium]
MDRQPNLLLIVLDSLRADHMSLHGYGRLTTPHIDRFAAGGVVLEDVLSPHIPTTPAFAGLLTGLDCFGTGVVSLRHKGAMTAPTLAALLQDRGYETTCVGFKDTEPCAPGFGRYLDYVGWGAWEDGRCPKAENLAAVALPELRRLAGSDRPFFLMLRYLDPHAPYLPPAPFERMFYAGDECDPANTSMRPVLAFRPMRDFQASWLPPGITDIDYVIAQYDGAVAYADACLQGLFEAVSALGLDEDTLVVLTADHGETLDEHDCYFDHHGLYECTLRVPLVFRMPGRLPAGRRLAGTATLQDVAPTVLDLLGIRTDAVFDGRSLADALRHGRLRARSELYLTEATWMRKHAWRTPEWKLIRALEPDFHFKPEVELYNLLTDPGENENLAGSQPDVVDLLTGRMRSWIRRREGETARRNPMFTEIRWHDCAGVEGAFESSQQAYDTLHIGPKKPSTQPRSREDVLKALGYM